MAGLLLLSCQGSFASPAQTPLVVGVYESRPWAYLERGKYRGIHVDIFKAVLQRMGHRYSFRPMPLKRLNDGITAGRIDASVYLSTVDKPQRSDTAYLLIGETPFYRSNDILITLRSEPTALAEIEHPNSKRIGILRHSPTVRTSPLFRNFSRLYQYNKMLYAIKALMSRRIDVVAGHPDMLLPAAAELFVAHHISILKSLPAFTILPVFSRVSLGAKTSAMAEEFNSHLLQLKSEGAIASIISTYSQLCYFDSYGAVLEERACARHRFSPEIY
ncbi:transporter substrate-binding domain-containing protein [Pseudomaricurvus alkylphenolicus]|nr:transporter substrate-binding domain-containing protein [Pseudomaricurvus alkylphenolicus]